jgi:outer membrane protein TolC
MNKASLGLFMILLAGCTVGPNYHKPAIQTPDSFRSPAPMPAGDSGSFGDLKWWEVFKDEKLQDLEKAALAQNFDLRDAVAHVRRRAPAL